MSAAVDEIFMCVKLLHHPFFETIKTMSRYSLEHILKNAKDLVVASHFQAAGYPMSDWVEHGVVGWDNHALTYFLQLDLPGDQADGDEAEAPAVWRGTSPHEIRTFHDLCGIIRKLFNVGPDVFVFKDVIETY